MASGHIRKRGDSWLLTIEAGRDSSGKRKRIYRTVRTKKEAMRLKHEMIVELERGTYVEPQKVSVGEYLDFWLESKKPNLAPRTYESYEMIIRRHLAPALGKAELDKLQPMAIEGYKNEKLATLSNRTVQYHLSVLSQALNQAVRLQMLIRNPVDAVEKPRVPKGRAEFLTPEQVDMLLVAAKGEREYPAAFLALHTGMRLGEVLGLQWDFVDLEEKIVHVRCQLQVVENKVKLMDILKTDSSYRSIPISQPVVDMLKGLSRPSEYVFCIPKGHYAGKPFDPTNFDNRFTAICEGAKLKGVTFHTLRHTHASLLLAAGVPLNVVQERLGHERASTTLDIYAHVLPGSQEKSADMFVKILEGRQNGDKNGATEKTDA